MFYFFEVSFVVCLGLASLNELSTIDTE